MRCESSIPVYFNLRQSLPISLLLPLLVSSPQLGASFFPRLYEVRTLWPGASYVMSCDQSVVEPVFFFLLLPVR